MLSSSSMGTAQLVLTGSCRAATRLQDATMLAGGTTRWERGEQLVGRNAGGLLCGGGGGNNSLGEMQRGVAGGEGEEGGGEVQAS